MRVEGATVRTWNGLVELVIDGESEGQVHADLAAERRGTEEVWWGQLRGAGGYDLGHERHITLRLPDGRRGQVVRAVVDDHDVYHRTEINGRGAPPF